MSTDDVAKDTLIRYSEALKRLQCIVHVLQDHGRALSALGSAYASTRPHIKRTSNGMAVDDQKVVPTDLLEEAAKLWESGRQAALEVDELEAVLQNIGQGHMIPESRVRW